MTEDEAFEELDHRMKMGQQILDSMVAVTAAEEFVQSLSNSELSIMTIRKAYEIGYKQGFCRTKK